MSWGVEQRGGAVVVTMRSNPVNRMNPQFFDDLHQALDTVEQRHPGLPLVLTAEGATFSAGLDFEDVFPRFARNDMAQVLPWFERFRGALLRVFTLPRRTVAALNGHTFAGGLILAVACDCRLAAAGPARFAINEVPVGIPMPATYTELVRYAVGSRSAAEAILEGRLYTVDEALARGFVHEVVPAERLLDEAIARACLHPPDCASAYALSKQILQRPVLQQLEGSRELDEQALRVVMSPDSVRAQQAALARLKKKA
jgi:enoyl-CoA hydratase/carnithine racemase